LIGCAPLNGRIYFVGKSFGGSLSDKNLYDLPDNWIHQKLESFETIIADKGFRGTNLFFNFHFSNLFFLIGCEVYHSFLLPKKKEGEYNLSIDIYNRDFKAIRCIIENSIGEIKKWKITSTKNL
jgi:hypothetical protein